MIRLRIPIHLPSGRKLRALLYARYSSEDSNPNSIDHQFAYGMKFLAENGVSDADVEIVFLEDREISGEQVSRPGIDRLKEMIDRRELDILIVEDCSRLYRHESACLQLAETAVDSGVRLISVNDFVDSAEPDWHDRLSEAARHHAKSNAYVSNRIKRFQEANFRRGGATGALRTGYRRVPTHPATPREPERGPFFDSIDPDEARVVHEAFQRVAAQEPTWSVAMFLNEAKLRRCSTAKSPVWDAKAVQALVKRSVYRGLETYRVTISIKKWGTGKRRPQKNDLKDVLSREVPHLLIVDDALWFRANKAISDASTGGRPPAGDDNPLRNVPRDSRFPLSKLLICGKCRGKMWLFGAKNRYRCSNTRRKFVNDQGRWESVCDNGAGAPKDLAHRRISEVVVQELLGLTGVAETLVATIASRLADDAPRQQEIRDLRKREADLQGKCLRLAGQIEDGRPGTSPSETLGALLRQRERELTVVQTDLRCLESHPAAALRVAPDEIRQRIDDYRHRLLNLDRRSGPLLAQLIDGKIHAVPYQQLGCSTVVLRAEFDFRPVGILPESLRAALSDAESEAVATLLPKKRIVIDLFDPTPVPANAMKALALKDESPKITQNQLAERLGITPPIAYRALKLGEKVRAAELTDPYIRLVD